MIDSGGGGGGLVAVVVGADEYVVLLRTCGDPSTSCPTSPVAAPLASHIASAAS